MDTGGKMADDERRMPAGMAGLTSYTDVNPDKLKMRPEHVMGIVAIAVILEILMYVMYPV